MFKPLIARINTDIFDRRTAFGRCIDWSTRRMAPERAIIRDIRVIRGSQVFDLAL